MGSHRRSVDKLKPLDLGPSGIDVLVAGSGDADLIDSFTAKLERSLRSYSKSNQLNTLEDVIEAVETELAAFYDVDIRLCPSDVSFKLFITACVKATGAFEVWVTKNVRLVRMEPDYALVGWDETLYDIVLSRFCQTPLKFHQAILACIYAISTAEATCKEVKGPILVASVRADGIRVESSDYVSERIDQLKRFDSQVTDLFLKNADPTVSREEVSRSVDSLAESALAINKSQRLFFVGIGGARGNSSVVGPAGFVGTMTDGTHTDAVDGRSPSNFGVTVQPSGETILHFSAPPYPTERDVPLAGC